MIKWTDHKDALQSALSSSRSRSDAARHLSAVTGQRITEDMVSGAMRRLGFARSANVPVTRPAKEDRCGTLDKPFSEEETKRLQTTEAPDVSYPTASPSLPRRVICDGDTHYPIHDPYVEAAKMAFARDVKPDEWVNLGDAFDIWTLSRFEKQAEIALGTSGRLQHEFDAAAPYWKEVSSISNRVTLILGNHERRLGVLINSNPGLYGLRALEWSALAGLPSKVVVRPHGARHRIGPLWFEHGDAIGAGSRGLRHPAQKLMERRPGKNTICGHWHRIETKHKTEYDWDGNPSPCVAISQGHGSDISKALEWIDEPDWQHGFTYIEFWEEAGKPRFTAFPIAVIDGRFSWMGKVYDGRKCQ